MAANRHMNGVVILHSVYFGKFSFHISALLWVCAILTFLSMYCNPPHMSSLYHSTGMPGTLPAATYPQVNYQCVNFILSFFFSLSLWRCDPMCVMPSSFLRFLDHTRRRTTVGRTPLDEWSARCKGLYLTTHNTHNRQISMPPVGFEPTISAGERPQSYALDRAATGSGLYLVKSLPKFGLQNGHELH